MQNAPINKLRTIAPIHMSLLWNELREMLPDESLGLYAWKAIGRKLDDWLANAAKQPMRQFPGPFPVKALFLWINKHGGLDVNQLADEQGAYFDNWDLPIPASVPRTLSGVEQLAAYGLWLLQDAHSTCGSFPTNAFETNNPTDHGWSTADVREHWGETMLRAYQALTYCQRMQAGTPLREAEAATMASIDFSALGLAGSNVRLAPMRALKEYAQERFKRGSWRTFNEAARALKGEIADYGRTINAQLKKTNEERKLAEWFSEAASAKNLPPSSPESFD